MRINENDVERFLHESNAIEGVYDEGSYVDARKAWDYLMKQDVLTTAVVLTTHKLLMKNQNLRNEEKGHYRKCIVYIGGKSAMPHTLVPMEMQQWLFETMRAHPKPMAQALHVKFEQIHPFVDGNGRIGRMLWNWTRIKRCGLEIGIIREADRDWYYQWFRV